MLVHDNRGRGRKCGIGGRGPTLKMLNSLTDIGCGGSTLKMLNNLTWVDRATGRPSKVVIWPGGTRVRLQSHVRELTGVTQISHL